MITVDLKRPTDGKKKPSKFFFVKEDKNHNSQEYPFFIENVKLAAIGKSIAGSRCYIPTSFQGSWDNIFNKLEGVRIVDFIDFLVYAIPTVVCPMVKNAGARQALFELSKGCGLALQWSISEVMITKIEK